MIRVSDRSADGSMFQVQCESCGAALDWVSGVELTAMAIRGFTPALCFDCAGAVAEMIPDQLLCDGWVANEYQFIYSAGQGMALHQRVYVKGVRDDQ